MPLKKLEHKKIVTDAGTDVRSEINEDIVTEYAADIKKGDKFPPMVVFDTKDGLLLANGFHRLFGYERQGWKSSICDVRTGKRSDAIKFALGSNTDHGLRRTNADKRRAVEIALKEFPDSSDRVIADICAVSHPFVAEIAKGSGGNVTTSNGKKPNKSQESEPVKRKGKDGKKYKAPARPSASLPPKRPEEPPAKTKDATNIEVPEEIVEYWDTTFSESQRLLTLVSEVRTRLKRAQESNEPAFRELKASFNGIVAHLDQVYADLKCVKPYAVCPECNGVKTKGCEVCRGRGFISEFYWKNNISIELKKATGRE